MLLATVSFYLWSFNRFFSCVIDSSGESSEGQRPLHCLSTHRDEALAHCFFYGHFAVALRIHGKLKHPEWADTYFKKSALSDKCGDGDQRQGSFAALVALTEPGNCRCAARLQPPYITEKRGSQRHASKADELLGTESFSDTCRHQSWRHFMCLKICWRKEQWWQTEGGGNTFFIFSESRGTTKQLLCYFDRLKCSQPKVLFGLLQPLL